MLTSTNRMFSRQLGFRLFRLLNSVGTSESHGLILLITTTLFGVLALWSPCRVLRVIISKRRTRR